jgi:hypothetical protein
MVVVRVPIKAYASVLEMEKQLVEVKVSSLAVSSESSLVATTVGPKEIILVVLMVS